MSQNINPQTGERQRWIAFRAFLGGRDDIAEPLYLSALEQVQAAGQEDSQMVHCLHSLARIRISDARLPEAEEYFLRGLAVCASGGGPDGETGPDQAARDLTTG